MTAAFEESWWSVCLRIPPNQAAAMSATDAMGDMLVADLRMARFWRSDTEGPGAPTKYLTLELRARSRHDAERYAQELVGAVRAAAELPADPLAVEWSVPVGDDEDSSHRFWEQANELFDGEMYEMAVVAAEIHLDRTVQVLRHRAATRLGSESMRRLLKDSNARNIHREAGIGALELLLDVDLASRREWNDYKQHVKRRNAVIHAGATVTKDEARHSLDAVHALWLILVRADRGP